MRVPFDPMTAPVERDPAAVGAWPVRLLVPTTAALARVLGVSAPAIRKAESWGKIKREDDGTWDVLAAVEGWRYSTDSRLQRRSRTRLRCLSPARRFTRRDLAELVERTRGVGGEVIALDDDVDAVPDDG